MNCIQVTQQQGRRKYNNLYNRCYNERVHELKPWYRDCTICDEWLSLPGRNEDKTGRQRFIDWVNDGNFYEIEGEPTVELDHNILVKGNTIYSPETCIYAPKSINSMFSGFHGRKNDLPVGVLQLPNGLYKPQVQDFKWAFKTQEEAWQIYAEYQKGRVIEVANRYYGQIPMKLYEAMLAWKFEITD